MMFSYYNRLESELYGNKDIMHFCVGTASSYLVAVKETENRITEILDQITIA